MSLQIKHSNQVFSSQIPDCSWFCCAKRNVVLREVNVLPFHGNKQGMWISKLIYPVQILAMPERLNSLFSHRPDDFMIISHFSHRALRTNWNFFISWQYNHHYPIHFVLRRSLCGNLLTCSFCSSFLHREYCSLWKWFSSLLQQMKNNMERVGKFSLKFSPEIITFSDHVFGERTGKWSFKAVPHSHLHAKKTLCRQNKTLQRAQVAKFNW